MSTKNSDWELRGVVSTVLTDCAALWDCIDISERTKNVGDRTFTYCGTGHNARLLSVDPAQKTPGTGTLVGPDEEVLDVIEEFEDTECPAWFQLVSCDGEVRHYSGVYWGNRSSQNALTAQGPNAQSAPLIENVSFQFDRITRIREKKKVPLGQFVSEEGYNVGSPVFGSVNGTNTTFRLQYEPLGTYPVLVYIDDVLQGSGYTVTGRSLVFDVAPACDEVITVDYYDERYAVYGLCPVSVMYCSKSCSNPSRCAKCGDVYAVYESTVSADPDVCGNVEGNVMAVGYWTYNRGDLTLNSVTIITNVVGPVDAVCTESGEIVVIAANGVFEGCDAGYSSISSTLFPAGATFNSMAYDLETREIHVLYNTTGVLSRTYAGQWSVSLNDLTLTTEQQNDIAAMSGTIVTVGQSNTVQVSSSNGSVWTLEDGPDTTATDLIAVGVGITTDPNDDRVIIGVLGSNADSGQTTYYITGDWADTWSEARKTWDIIPTNNAQVEMFEDWLVYVQVEDELWRNTNRGCDKCGAWELLLDSGYMCSILAMCYKDPNRVSVFSRPSQAAVPDNGVMDGTFGQVTTFDVLANDYTDDCATGIDTSTLAVVQHWFAGTGNQTSPTGGTLNITVTGITPNEVIQVDVTATVADGEVAYVQYTVDTDCGDTLTGLLVIDFLA